MSENSEFSNFYQPSVINEKDVHIYKSRLLCLQKPQDIRLWGNYDTANTNNLMIVFEKCSNATSSVTCKSNEEILKWMKSKYLVTLVNQKKFVQNKFDEERIDRHSIFNWYALNPTSRTDYANEIIRTELELADSMFNLGSLFPFKDKGFYMLRLLGRELPYDN